MNLFSRILRWLTDEEEQLESVKQPKIQFLIVDMSRKWRKWLPLSLKVSTKYDNHRSK